MAFKKIVLMLFCVILFSGNISYAASPSSVSVYLRPDVTIMVGEQIKSFYDENGKPVFPLNYQGSTYLPVRAVSALMNENIEWAGKNKTIYIGRTLSEPGSQVSVASDGAVRDGSISSALKPAVQLADAFVRPDIIVMYDFEVQNFFDENGKLVYPVNYQGSNYLPIRAVSKLMGDSIEWDAGQKLITISARSDSSTANEENKYADELKDLFSDTVTIFDEATAKIMKIQEDLTSDELLSLTASVNSDVKKINRMIEVIKDTDKSEFTGAELDAYENLIAYANSAGYYILIVENIIYMAADGQDYSMFAETFLNFALDAQTKYEAARDTLRNL